MPNTYTQLLVHFVFAVKFRNSLIAETHRDRIEKYICGIVSNNGHKPLAIFCMPDHCHLLVGLKPNQPISDLVKIVKANSSKWINEEKIIPFKFAWQEGFGGFTYSKSQLNNVVQYILNQPEHHKKKTFKDEYVDFLEKFEVDFDERFLFKSPE